jgi:hypothetical protein
MQDGSRSRTRTPRRSRVPNPLPASSTANIADARSNCSRDEEHRVTADQQPVPKRANVSPGSLFLVYGVIALLIAILFSDASVVILTAVMLSLAVYMDRVALRGHFFIPLKDRVRLAAHDAAPQHDAIAQKSDPLTP